MLLYMYKDQTVYNTLCRNHHRRSSAYLLLCAVKLAQQFKKRHLQQTAWSGKKQDINVMDISHLDISYLDMTCMNNGILSSGHFRVTDTLRSQGTQMREYPPCTGELSYEKALFSHCSMEIHKRSKRLWISYAEKIPSCSCFQSTCQQ